MTNITVNDGFAFNHSALDLSLAFTNDLTEHLSTSLQFALNGTTQLRLIGENIVYDAGNHPTDGAIHGIQSFVSGSPAFSLTGADLDLGDVFAADPTLRKTTARNEIFSGDDVLLGGSLRDYFNSLGGHDVVMGGAGSDTIYGGNGNDHLYGQSPNGGADGDDSIAGDDGSDYIQGNAGNDYIDGGRGSDRINGGAGNDHIFANEDNDTVNGNTGNDTIDGWSGNDSLRGGQGNDSMDGGFGNDVVMGDLGNDTLRGGGDADILTGGQGADVFILSPYAGQASDPAKLTAITDFTHGEDHIDLGYSHLPNAVLSGSALSYQAALQQAQSMMFAHDGDNEVVAMQVGADTYLFYTPTPMSFVPTAAFVAFNASAADFAISDFVR